MTHRPSAVLLRGVRPVPVGVSSGAQVHPVDLLIRDGVVASAEDVDTSAIETIDADGRWVVPGLWDKHVHLTQWARTAARLDVSAGQDAAEVVDIVRRDVAARTDDTPVVGWGYRSSAWSQAPDVAALDAVTGSRPVALVGGDGHNAWLNSAALTALGLPARTTPLDENEWFTVFHRLGELERELDLDAAYRTAISQAHALGVVGIVDLEFDAAAGTWADRAAAGIDSLRVRVGVYPDRVEDVIAAGLRTGDVMPGCGDLVRMGPLKIISDGSLGTRTAFCCDPYPAGRGAEFPCGKQNFTRAEQEELLARAVSSGLEVAVHAIGDAACHDALVAVARTGARGSIEHAQLMRWEDVQRLADLRLTASVQPAHLLDDRALTERNWPGRERRCFMLRSMLDAGVRLALGSDAPVAPLDPWLAMAAAVHRGGAGEQAWVAEQAISPAEALAASVDERGTVAPGSVADLVLLDHDPLAAAGTSSEAAGLLRGTRAALTMVAGRIVHDELR